MNRNAWLLAGAAWLLLTPAGGAQPWKPGKAAERPKAFIPDPKLFAGADAPVPDSFVKAGFSQALKVRLKGGDSLTLYHNAKSGRAFAVEDSPDGGGRQVLLLGNPRDGYRKVGEGGDAADLELVSPGRTVVIAGYYGNVHPELGRHLGRLQAAYERADYHVLRLDNLRPEELGKAIARDRKERPEAYAEPPVLVLYGHGTGLGDRARIFRPGGGDIHALAITDEVEIYPSREDLGPDDSVWPPPQVYDPEKPGAPRVTRRISARVGSSRPSGGPWRRRPTPCYSPATRAIVLRIPGSRPRKAPCSPPPSGMSPPSASSRLGKAITLRSRRCGI